MPTVDGKGPLTGVRVLDLGRTLAGFTAPMIMGDLGAEVIKVEDRTTRPGGVSVRLDSGYVRDGIDIRYISVNRNKKSVVIDLKQEKGKEVFFDLVRVADVVVNNYRPGVMDQRGLGYEKLREINPRIVYCSITGFGDEGPYRDHRALDPSVQAISGIMSLTGEKGRQPVFGGVPLVDLASAYFAVQGTLAALYQRERTGLGQRVDCSMLWTALAMLSYGGHFYLNTGEAMGPGDVLLVGFAICHAFRTRTDDIVIVVISEAEWQAFCQVLGHEELLEDPRFATAALRIQNRDELLPVVRKTLIRRNDEDWLQELVAASICCAPVNTLDRAFSDPQVQQSGMIVPMKMGEKDIRVIGNPIRLSGQSHQPYEPPPNRGQHTDEVLAELLQYSAERLEQLRRDQLVE